MNSTDASPTRPERSFRVGAVRAAVWVNTVRAKDGSSFQKKRIVLERRYRDANGDWKSTNSYDINDIPKARLALHQAYAYLTAAEEKEEEKTG